MPFLSRRSPFFVAIFLIGSAASAQNEVVSPSANYGDWLFQCAPSDPARCALTQRIVNSESRDVVAEVGFARLADEIEGYAMVLSVPEGVELTTAPIYEVHNDYQNVMAWRVCVNGRCQASASVTVDQSRKMNKAGSAVFRYFAYGQKNATGTTVSFKGLSDGLAALGAK